MPGNLTEKAQASQGKLEKLISSIPGYGGYRNKEQRRDADKLLRMHVARQYEQQLRRLNEVQRELTSRGRLSSVLALERATIKLQLLIDRIKTASYGYRGLFDAVKIQENELDKLYEFDENMLEGVGELAVLMDKLQEAVKAEAPSSVETNDLIAKIEDLNDAFSRRQDLFLD